MSSIKSGSLAATLAKISHLLDIQKKQGYIVGGFIRDCLLGRDTNDIDIAVNGAAVTIAREVAGEIGGKFVLLDDVNDVARVVVIEDKQTTGISQNQESHGAEWHFDFSPFTGDIETDLARRDFTINAMALELSQFVTASTATKMSSRKLASLLTEKQSSLKLIDPFSGKEDLRDKIVRGVSEQIFEADTARLLRAVRLAAELDFTIEPDTESLIRRYSQAITEVPGERIREELLRLLTLPRAAYYLRYLDTLGLLLGLIPELADGKGVEQPTAHFWDVFDHSLQTVAAIEFLIRESDWEYSNDAMLSTAPWSDMIDRHLSQEVSSGSNHKVLLKLAGLFHDIAKPMTKSIDDTGRARFLGHTKQGAAMTANILERLRFSNREIRLLESLVYHHLRPVQMANGEFPSQRAIYRYFRDTGDAGIDILVLALADFLASRGPLVSMEDWGKHCQLINYILAEHDNQQAKILPVKLIDGHDIMDTFGLAPGPLVGKLLAMVNEAHASGELSTREEALALVRRELSTVSKQQTRVSRKSQNSGVKTIPNTK
ncbi:MAG: CCA tRNA nucleotidyltransferase [Dehalococcoidia bacterium]|nr:MAG: CCA tRNA nucleotidyltransferase [Dehalococcoidia bacterium]